MVTSEAAVFPLQPVVSWAPPTYYSLRKEMNLLVLGILGTTWGDCIKTRETHRKKKLFEKIATAQ